MVGNIGSGALYDNMLVVTNTAGYKIIKKKK